MSHAKASRGMCSQEIRAQSFSDPQSRLWGSIEMPLRVNSSLRQIVIDGLDLAYEKTLSSLQPVDLSHHDVAFSYCQNADGEL